MTAAHDDALDALEQLPPEGLWAVARDPAHPLRVVALRDLRAADDLRLRPYLLNELETYLPDREPWAEELLGLIETTQFIDECFRVRLCVALPKAAYELSLDAPDPGIVDLPVHRAVRSALRRFASIVPEPRADRMLAFLTPATARWVRNVALFGIANIYSVSAPDGPVAEALRAEVNAQARAAINPETVKAAYGSAYVVELVAAARALNDPDAPQFADDASKLSAFLGRMIARRR